MLKPKVQRLADSFIQACNEQGIEIIIIEGYRSIKRQNELYEKGRTTPGPIVTNAKGGQSLHNYGVAFDICFLVNGNRTYSGDWEKVGKIGESLGLEWGGNWISFRDRPHFQYMAGYTLLSFINKRIDESRFA